MLRCPPLTRAQRFLISRVSAVWHLQYFNTWPLHFPIDPLRSEFKRQPLSPPLTINRGRGYAEEHQATKHRKPQLPLFIFSKLLPDPQIRAPRPAKSAQPRVHPWDRLPASMASCAKKSRKISSPCCSWFLRFGFLLTLQLLAEPSPWPARPQAPGIEMMRQ
jgi:hypothetical protein